MANSAPQAGEPTMEEILASIRRIISEEEAEAAPASVDVPPRAEPEPEEDVLELTEIVPEPEPEPAPRPRPVLVEPPSDVAFEPDPEPMPIHSGLVADVVADQAKAAFDLLHRDMPVAHTAVGVSLEAIVRELLKPLLKQWLDTNLTEIVERIVREEVERVANRRR